MRRLLGQSNFIGNMAKWAVCQHPYHKPPRLDEVTQAIINHAESTFADGVPTHKMRWFDDSSRVHDWLKAALEPVADILALWNSRANGNDAPYNFTSRYDGPSPENDFIDIDALTRNVAHSAWVDSEEYEERAA